MPKILLFICLVLFPCSVQAQKRLLPIQVGQRLGCKDVHNHWVIQPRFCTIEVLAFDNDPNAKGKSTRMYAKVKGHNGKYGLYNDKGSKVLDTAFHDINYVNGYLQAAIDGSAQCYRLYATDGTLIPGPGYRLIPTDKGFLFAKGGKYYLYRQDMKLIAVLDSAQTPSPIYVLSDSLYYIEYPLQRKYRLIYAFQEDFNKQVIFEGLKFGFVNTSHKEIFPPSFNKVEMLEENCFLLHGDTESILVDSSGSILFKTKNTFERLEYMEYAKCMKVFLNNLGQFLLVNMDGSLVVKDTLEDVDYSFSSGKFNILYARKTRAGEQIRAIINRNGKLLIAPKYTSIWEDAHDNYIVEAMPDDANKEENGRFGLLDSLGNVIFPCRFIAIEADYNDGYWVSIDSGSYNIAKLGKGHFRNKELKGFADNRGKIIFLSDSTIEINGFNSGLARAKYSVNLKGYDDYPDNDNEPLKLENQYCYIGKDGRQKGTRSFVNCSDFWHGTAVVMNLSDSLNYYADNGVRIDMLDTNSILQFRPKKPMPKGPRVPNILLDIEPCLRGENFLLYDLKDSFLFLRKDGDLPLKAMTYYGYKTLPFELSNNNYFVLNFRIFLKSLDKKVKQPRWPDEDMPNGFALLKNGKYALFDDEGKQCSGFVIDSIENTSDSLIKIKIGLANGYLDETYKVLAWSERKKPAIRRNKKKEWNHMKVIQKAPVFYPCGMVPSYINDCPQIQLPANVGDK